MMEVRRGLLEIKKEWRAITMKYNALSLIGSWFEKGTKIIKDNWGQLRTTEYVVRMPGPPLAPGTPICPCFLYRSCPTAWLILLLLPHKKGFLICLLWLQLHLTTLLWLPQSWPRCNSSSQGASLSNTQPLGVMKDMKVNFISATYS